MIAFPHWPLWLWWLMAECYIRLLILGFDATIGERRRIERQWAWEDARLGIRR